MSILHNKVSLWWIRLDPTVQYITWICTFCASVALGILLVVLAAEGVFGPVALYLLYSIGFFVMAFLYVVIYLTVRWPTIRKAYLNRYKKYLRKKRNNLKSKA